MIASIVHWSNKMNIVLPHSSRALAMTILLTVTLPLVAASDDGAKRFDVLLKNSSFTEGVDQNGIPNGWSRYGRPGKNQELSIVTDSDGRKALRIADGSSASEIGVVQSVALKGEVTYQISAEVKAIKGASTDGAYLQLRFLPSNQLVQTSLGAAYSVDVAANMFSEVSVQGTAPSGTTTGVIYLYTHAAPTPRVLVTDVKLVGGLPPPPPPPPAPVPPQYDKLKKLYRDIGLVVVLNHRCQKVWSTRLASAPRSLKAIAPKAIAPSGTERPWIVVGCDDGAVTALDQHGRIVGAGKVVGRPVHIETLATSAGPVVVLATDQGEIIGFHR